MNLSSFHCLIMLFITSLYHDLTFAQQTVVITIPPRSVNVSLNGVAEFNCSGIGSLLVWSRDGADLVNGNDGIVIKINASQDPLMSTLSLLVSSTDASNITCTAVRTSPLSKNESEPALLLIQGLLESVGDLTVSHINYTTVLISWSPPFTLEGLPILSYNVTITTSGENDTVRVAGDATMLYYSIQNSFIVTVVPINSVGPGDKASLLHTVSSTTSQVVFPSPSTVTSAVSPTPPSSAPFLPSNQLAGIIVGVVVVCAVVIVAVIAILIVVWCVLKQCKDKANIPTEEKLNVTESKSEKEDVPDSHESNKILTSHKCKEVLSKLPSLSQDDITYGEKIGNGFFGVVYEAHLKDSGKHIAVKTCESSHSEAVKCQFLHEAENLREFDHPNIVKLIAVLQDPLSIVMEHVGQTFLDFLQTNGKTYEVNKLIEMCKQVCEGMEYLDRNICVHRGLTARNCLISSDFKVVKISNFGMSFGRVNLDLLDPKLRPVPIKWTAPEALNRDQYSSASDVWSFGVLLWETFSYGAEPYPGMTEEEVIEKVINQYRMTPPKGCPLPVFDLMLECWNFNPIERPSFAKLLKELCKLI